MKRLRFFVTVPLAVVVLAALIAGCGASKETAVVTERPEVTEQPAPPPTPVELRADEVTPSIQTGRFDTGKMWTFDNPPLDYFEEEYGFRPDSQWFARARLGTLRIPGCTASFVSPFGLVATNHHCARSAITGVARPGENLLDNGFYAESLAEEREAEDMYAEQLISISDVTDQVYGMARDVDDAAQEREQTVERLEARLTSEAKQRDTTYTVEVVELYDGGQYSAYTFRRYDDLRLVLAPELQLGSFGGDPDNFTYPRYSLDFTFFRIYGEDGEPFEPEVYFPWSLNGAGEGDPVFVVGNPGSTSRLNTVSQLLYERDYALPQVVDVLETRAELIGEYIEEHPERADEFDLRNVQHSLENSLKATRGELEGLRDEALIARRRAAEDKLREDIAASDTLSERYGDALGEIEQVQRSKAAMGQQAGAFTYFAAPVTDSHILIRAVYGYIISIMNQRGAPESRIEELREDALEIEDWPTELEEGFLAARLREVATYLGRTDPTVTRILGGRSPEEVASRIVEQTALADSASFAEILDEGFLESDDPAVPLANALVPLYFTVDSQVTGFNSRAEELNAQLARARFALYGRAIPPDATFSLRIADGVVKGYPYNGTFAPPHTTFFGMLNHYYSYGPDSPWALPERWLNLPPAFDLSTAVDLVSTNDITGGNSGSPLLSRDLEVVGLIFDSNIDALPNTFLYMDERGRAVSVDARGIMEALDEVYDADRIELELLTGQLRDNDEEANAELADEN